jgi:hypothetical protein
MGVVDGCQVYIPEPGVKVKLAGTPWKNLPRLLVCRADSFGMRRRRGFRGREKLTRYNTFDLASRDVHELVPSLRPGTQGSIARAARQGQ